MPYLIFFFSIRMFRALSTTEVFLGLTKKIADNFYYKYAVQHWLIG